jgi:uncharacterized protein (TIGR00290 family)
VFATHTGQDHGQLIKQMITAGYDICITQIAADGLHKGWLGKKLDAATFPELKKLSEKFGFHLGAEGGHYDTLVVDGPIFQKRLEILESETVMETECSGHLKVNRIAMIDKKPLLQTIRA